VQQYHVLIYEGSVLRDHWARDTHEGARRAASDVPYVAARCGKSYYTAIGPCAAACPNRVGVTG
jgi:hypothetical protein